MWGQQQYGEKTLAKTISWGISWRKGWDSNPRCPCRHAGFQDRCLKPLGHPSKPMIPRAKNNFAPTSKSPLLLNLLPRFSGGCDTRLIAGPNAKSRRRSNTNIVTWHWLSVRASQLSLPTFSFVQVCNRSEKLGWLPGLLSAWACLPDWSTA